MLTKKPRHKVFTVNLRDIDLVLKPTWKPSPDISIDPSTFVLLEYHKFLDIFFCQKSDEISSYGAYNHYIPLKERTEPFLGPLYGMSRKDNEKLCKYLLENLDKRFIRASQSFVASPFLFEQKPRGGLQFCVDCHGLNAITVKNWYPLPLITETLNQLSEAVIYNRFDVIPAFNRLKIVERDKWKIAFKIRYGLFEYIVRLFGLCNGLASFEHYINDTLRKYLDIFCTAYLDNILIYSNFLHENKRHVKIILERLRSTSLFLNLTKCEFHITEVLYLGFIINTYGIKIDSAKIKTILEWLQPACLKDVQSFFGFANFCWHFIYSYLMLVMRLVNLSKKYPLELDKWYIISFW